ncbi:MAG: amylo-alpha-1,6-glucosidase [Planctomycetota bacterium]
MITSVLETLERSGGHRLCLEGPPRWFAAPTPSAAAAASSSGRFASPGSLRADRTDDGLLVTAPAGLAGERIVWIGGVDLDLQPPQRSLQRPTIALDPERSRVEARWTTRAERALVRLEVLARPAGSVTFENEGLDPRVETVSGEGRSVFRVRPYGGLAAVCIEFDGSARFEPDPVWRRGVAVRHPSGAPACEDRLTPGVFHVALPADGTLRLVARVEPPAHEDVALDRLSGGTPRAALVEALALPGIVAGGALGLDGIADRLEGSLAVPSSAWTSTDPASSDDAALWRARAAIEVARTLRASGHVRDAELVGDVLDPGVLALLDSILDRAAERGSGPETVFRGTRRWFEVLDGGGAEQDPSTRSERGVAVETAALLHQLLAHSAWLAERRGERGRAERARALTIRSRRWFQRSFWLPTPRRLADVEIGGVPAGDSGPLALRPHMVLAAALAKAPLDPDQRRAVVRAAEDRLLTPLGLRSLDPEDERFDPAGPAGGATWPWLLGPYLEASMRAFGRDRGRDRLRRMLLDALETAPEAWCESGDAPTPIGALAFPPAFGEASRVRDLLARDREGGSSR